MKTIRKQLIIALFSFVILGILGGFYIMRHSSEPAGAAVEVSGTKETVSVDEQLLLSDSETYTTAADSSRTIPDSAALDVPYISQYPELPTGCEITSLAEVLTYYGFDIDKETLAKHYLPMQYERTTGCYINYFLGSPWSTNGSGCFAPAITEAANAFLLDKQSSLKAYTISYSSVRTLFEKVADGHPVIVWTSFNYDEPAVTYNEVELDNGRSFSWPSNEHCVVLSGYNLEMKTVTLADPAYGIVERSIDEFTYYYQKYFYQAVVIQ